MSAAAPWQVRAAAVTDAQAIAAARYHHGPAMQDLDSPLARDAVAHYARWLGPKIERNEYFGFLAFADGQLIGGVGAVLLDWGPRLDTGPVHTLARINNVFTVDAWRGRGLARLLTLKLLDECRARELVYVMLAGSQMGQSLYQSLGFDFKRNEMVLRLGAADTHSTAAAQPAPNTGSS
jgi:GNAT superfamily N-acetyltransferase